MLILDEPSAALDPIAEYELNKVIMELRDSNDDYDIAPTVNCTGRRLHIPHRERRDSGIRQSRGADEAGRKIRGDVQYAGGEVC